MAWAYTVDTVIESHINGWLYLASGTFTLTGATVKGTIETGLSKILIHSVHVDTGTVTEQLCNKKNVDEDGVDADGSIGILVAAANNVGTWQAIGIIGVS